MTTGLAPLGDDHIGAVSRRGPRVVHGGDHGHDLDPPPMARLDRKSTRLNSSHSSISYAVFCLKKKKKNKKKKQSISVKTQINSTTNTSLTQDISKYSY